MNTVKLFLEANTPKELVQKMIDNNRFHGTGFVYDNPQKNGTKWIVWFTANIAEYFAKDKNADY